MKNLFAALSPNVVEVKVAFQRNGDTPTNSLESRHTKIKMVPEEKQYSYKALASWELKPGDFVVVPASRDSTQFMFVARIMDIVETPVFDDSINYRWIIHKVDFAQFEEVLEREKGFDAAVRQMDLSKRREEIRDHLITAIGQDRSDELMKLLT